MTAAHTLYALHYAGTHIAFFQLGLPCLQIVDGQVGDVVVGIDGGNDFGILSGLHGQRCASMKGFLC